MARSRIVIVEGRSYLVPRKKYKSARRSFTNPRDTWSHIMRNIDDYGLPVGGESEGQAESEKAPKERKKEEKEPAEARKVPKKRTTRAKKKESAEKRPRKGSTKRKPGEKQSTKEE